MVAGDTKMEINISGASAYEMSIMQGSLGDNNAALRVCAILTHGLCIYDACDGSR